MKKVMFIVALATLALPSVASAGTAAGALSVKSAAVAPVHTAAKTGKAKSGSSGTILGITLGLVAVGAGIAAASSSHSASR